MQYTRENLRQIGVKLRQNLDKYQGKIAYAANKNLRLIIQEVDAYETCLAMPEKIKEYDQKRLEILQRISEGKIVKKNGEDHYDIAGKEKQVEAEVLKLQSEYSEDFEAWHKHMAEVNQIGKEKVAMEWHEISVSVEKIEKIDGAAMEPLLEFVEVQ